LHVVAVGAFFVARACFVPDAFGADAGVIETARTFGGQRPDVAPGNVRGECCPVVVMPDVGELGVIQPGTSGTPIQILMESIEFLIF